MAGELPATDRNRGGARVACEAIRRPEAGDVPGVPEDLGSKHLADPEHAREARPAGRHGSGAAPPVVRQGPVQPPEVGYELASPA